MSDDTGFDIVGVDIGGANLKYASASGKKTFSRHFAMWRTPDQLAETLAHDLQTHFSGLRRLVVTMTGELADCFVDRAEGVSSIVTHVQQAAAKLNLPETSYYGVDGSFHSADEAAEQVDVIAAANWHATASFVARQIAPSCTLIDIGSTTTDIIPITDGKVATTAKTDFDRLQSAQLVYIGCRRTPVCALVDQLTFRGQSIGVMNELFATIDDARLVLGLQQPRPDDTDSADGKPRSVAMAANRLARMIGLDRRDISIDDAQELANQVIKPARQRIADALTVNHQPGTQLVVGGHGGDLLAFDAAEVVSLPDQLGVEVSRCAPSFAIARLAALLGEEGDHRL